MYHGSSIIAISRNTIQLFQIILIDVYHRHGDITVDSKTQYHRHDASGEDSNKHCTVGFGLPAIDSNIDIVLSVVYSNYHCQY